MDLLDIAVFGAAVVSSGAYVCRLDTLKVGAHSPAIIVMHMALCVASIFSGYHAWTGATDGQDVAVVIGALAWIAVSLPTWAQGAVPKQFETAPAPLDEAHR